MENRINSLKEKIKEQKFKFTSQRQKILKVFLSIEEQHISAEEIYVFLQKEKEDISLATIYRTLELFTELAIIRKMDLGDGRNRYELVEEYFKEFHHHLIC